MVHGASKGSAKAAAELVRTAPQHLCAAWTRSDAADPGGRPCLEARVELRARRHAVDFRADTLHFPRYYKISPRSGVIPAHGSVTLTVRLRFTEKTRRTSHQHARGSALWTDLRVRVRRRCEEDGAGALAADSPRGRGAALWPEDDCLDAEYLEQGEWRHQPDRPRIKRSKDRRKDPHLEAGRGLTTWKRDRVSMHQSATFVKTLKLRPLLLSPGSECSICMEEMNLQRHAAGNEDERLFAFGCGHVFHTHCVVQMTEANSCPCGCMEGANCPLCRRPISEVENALLQPSTKEEEDVSDPGLPLRFLQILLSYDSDAETIYTESASA